ncbi:uncharacterized [Tachysurus ichikawai]
MNIYEKVMAQLSFISELLLVCVLHSTAQHGTGTSNAVKTVCLWRFWTFGLKYAAPHGFPSGRPVCVCLSPPCP